MWSFNRRVTFGAIFFASLVFAAVYTSIFGDYRTAVAPGYGSQDIDSLVFQEDDAEDRAIKKEQKNDNGECLTKRFRHPGMSRGLKMQFIHLPKTGGSSVQMAIDDWVQDNSRIQLFLSNSNDVRGSSSKCPSRVPEATVLIGHRGWGFCEDVVKDKRGIFTATAVRSAVSRMVSFYDYNLLKRSTPKAQQLYGNTASVTRHTLSDLVKQYNATTDVVEPGEAILRYSGSQQCRYMCGYQCLGPNARHNATFTPEYMLKKALENLQKTDCVAVTEHLNDLIDQLRFHLKWVPYTFRAWQEQNRLPSSMKSILDAESKAILEKWGWADQQLYEAAAIIADEKTKQARKCLAKWKNG